MKPRRLYAVINLKTKKRVSSRYSTAENLRLTTDRDEASRGLTARNITTTYMMVLTMRHVWRATFWFVDTDRQTHRQTYIQTDTQTDRQTDRQTCWKQWQLLLSWLLTILTAPYSIIESGLMRWACLPVCLSVSLCVCLSVAEMQKRDFLKN